LAREKKSGRAKNHGYWSNWKYALQDASIWGDEERTSKNARLLAKEKRERTSKESRLLAEVCLVNDTSRRQVCFEQDKII